jgi:2-keto-4-pentenoate hydratase/2-oxohepta-3-ene-1,7-dioic acid hydratase in catechol pathway
MRRTFPPAILCIGRNYADHAAEMGGQRPERPMVFMKNPASVVGASDEIVIPAVCAQGGPQVDFEGELAVVIAEDCSDVPLADALSVVGGYAVANDVSARWWQNHGSGGQFSRGKSFDTFCPMGAPVPAAEVGDPQSLRITTTLNGELMQDSSTSHMIFTVAELIADLSRGMTLLAGTVILTGTPSGVGHARKPPRYLAGGDVVAIAIERVGSISNRVVERR